MGTSSHRLHAVAGGRRGIGLVSAAVLLALMAIGLPGGTVAQASTTYTIIDLGRLGGGVSTGNAINASSDVVGGSYIKKLVKFDPCRFGGDECELHPSHPFSWIAGAITDLGTISGSSFQSFSNYAVAVNSTEVVVGCSAGNAFLVHSGQISQVGPDGFSVRGINDAGTMAGCLDSHAYLLSSGGTLTQLPDLSPNGGGGNTPSSHAFGINNGNQIIGTSNNSQEFPRGDLERRNPHRPRALGGLSSVGEAINNLGQAVGYSATARGPTTRSSTTAAT